VRNDAGKNQLAAAVRPRRVNASFPACTMSSSVVLPPWLMNIVNFVTASVVREAQTTSQKLSFVRPLQLFAVAIMVWVYDTPATT
jgi:hypothetical protein